MASNYEWSDGYVSEIDYTFGYYPELNPLRIAHAQLHAGIRRIEKPRPRYLELGYGQGLSLNIHAAAISGEYWGTDFNPSQAAGSLEMAHASGAPLNLLDASFDELLRNDDLPTFDIIALHGVWSWISDENRRHILEIIRRRLAPGGCVYISYNCTPGWSPSMPLRHLLSLHANMAEGDAKGLLGRIEGALSFANELVQAQARFFQINPSVVERLKAISGQDRRYLAHEYFNADWHPTPFSELASSLNQAKLSFGASANLLDHIEKLHVTEAGAQLLAKEKHVVLRETLRDYLVNQQFRRDIFIRGPRSLPLLERTKHLHDLAVVSLCDLSTIPMTIPGLVGEIKLSENIYRPIIETIQEIESSKRSMDESCTLAMIEEKIRQLTATPINFAQIVQATTVLVHQGKLGLAQRSEFVRSSQSHCDRLNTWIIRQSAASGDIGFLASPIVGGVAVSRIEQLVMLVRSKESDNLNTIATTIWKILEGQGQRLTKNGQALKDEAENIEEMKLQVATFLKDKYPILKRLGIYCRPSDQEYYY